MRNLNNPLITKPNTQKGLEDWFQSNLGRSLLSHQRSVIADTIQQFFGVIQAEVGVSHRLPVGNPSNIVHKFLIISEWTVDLPSNVLVSESNELALETGSVDLVILHHTLDFAKDPHQALREASRILKSTGHLMIIGFNPTSLWGARKLFNGNKQAPWNNRFMSGKRLTDWLNLLHFQVGDLEYHYYGLPYNRLGLVKHFLWLEKILNPKLPLGAYYILSAQKQTFSKIQSTQRWAQQPAKASGLSLSSSRNVYKIKHHPHAKNNLSE